METIPKAIEELDNPGNQFTELGLRTSTVLRMILEQFSNSELLTLSLVNKQWNFEARSLLRGRGGLVANITSLDPFTSLADLTSYFRQMQAVARFSGITFLVSFTKTLRMDLLFAVPLMCYGVCLENVAKLELFVRPYSLENIPLNILNLLKQFDFTRVFPKLEHVEIVNHRKLAFTPDQISEFVEQGNAISIKTLRDRAINITQLTIADSIWESALPFWAQMFPEVKALTVYPRVGGVSLFLSTLLWEQFYNVEEISVRSCDLSYFAIWGLDSVFCGIFPEEVDELMKKDDEFLTAVNIVPVMPSVTCMKRLRSIKLDFELPFLLGAKPETTYLCSKVTTLTAFGRCPALAVTFEASSYS